MVILKAVPVSHMFESKYILMIMHAVFLHLHCMNTTTVSKKIDCNATTKYFYMKIIETVVV